jgi:hypothetical protein
VAWSESSERGGVTMARTETLTFDVVHIYHPYLAIFGRGFMKNSMQS